MLTNDDLLQMSQAGIKIEDVRRQLDYFKTGFPFAEIEAPATKDRGIMTLSIEEQEQLLDEVSKYNGEIVKFVPASGAATRMFKELYEAEADILSQKNVNDKSEKVFEQLSKFAFYKELATIPGFDRNNRLSVIEHILREKGLNYGSLPKGMLKFHKYADEVRTAFEEHLVEAALYAKGPDGIARIVFTVSPEHMDGFKKLADKVLPVYQRKYNCRFKIDFTVQKPSTDTIAVDENNMPFRLNNGKLLFRPGGHGALIANLNDIYADIVVIKNIDNVVKESMLSYTITWKKILIGILLRVRSKVFKYLELLDGEKNEALYPEIIDFLKSTFMINIPQIPNEILKEYLRAKLDRPVRVCGMVVNTGEPGGGPFIVKDADGSTSLQILESAQINLSDELMKSYLKNSTHFNPVDVVCSFTDHHGEKFDLSRFVDPETGFISVKSFEGRSLKAQELPGLWNGAMSQWNTVFVEVPVETFNPVKTISDLLRAEHQ